MADPMAQTTEVHLVDPMEYPKEYPMASMTEVKMADLMVSLKDSRKEYSMVYLTEVSLASRKVHLLK